MAKTFAGENNVQSRWVLNKQIALAFLVAAVTSPVEAARIDYSSISLGGSAWRYDYVVVNDGSSSIDEFSVYFDKASFASLSVLGSAPGWDALVVQPDLSLPANGFFDALALVNGLTPGDSVAGFSVSFNYLAGGVPGGQPFEIIDPSTFAVVEAGFTSLLTSGGGNGVPTPIPEPSSSALLLGGLVSLAILGRRRGLSK